MLFFTAGTFTLNAYLSLPTRGGSCGHLAAPSETSGVHEHSTEGVTGSRGREEADRVGGGISGGIGVGGGNVDRNGVGGENRDAKGYEGGDGAGPRTGVMASEKTQNVNRDGRGDGVGTGTETSAGVETRGRTQFKNGDGSGDGNEISNGYGNRDRDRNEDRIGEGGGEARMRYKPHKSCKRDVGNGEDLGEEKKNVNKKGLVQ